MADVVPLLVVDPVDTASRAIRTEWRPFGSWQIVPGDNVEHAAGMTVAAVADAGTVGEIRFRVAGSGMTTPTIRVPAGRLISTAADWLPLGRGDQRILVEMRRVSGTEGGVRLLAAAGIGADAAFVGEELGAAEGTALFDLGGLDMTVGVLAPVSGAPPENVVAPSVVGDPRVGVALSVNVGEWLRATSFTYQWETEFVEVPDVVTVWATESPAVFEGIAPGDYRVDAVHELDDETLMDEEAVPVFFTHLWVPPPPPPVGGAGALLRSPPTLEPNPLRITVDTFTANRSYVIPADRDVVLTMPDGIYRGNLHLEGGRHWRLIGGHMVAGSWMTECIDIKNPFGRVHIEGFIIDGTGVNNPEPLFVDNRTATPYPNDCIRIVAPYTQPNSALTLQNCWLTATGIFEGAHGDCVQTWQGPGTLEVDHVVAISGYQVMYLEANDSQYTGGWWQDPASFGTWAFESTLLWRTRNVSGGAAAIGCYGPKNQRVVNSKVFYEPPSNHNVVSHSWRIGKKNEGTTTTLTAVEDAWGKFYREPTLAELNAVVDKSKLGPRYVNTVGYRS